MNNLNEHDKATQAKFDKWAKHFEETGFMFKYFQKKVISNLDMKPNSSFLDLGCGTGWAVRYASQFLKGEGNFIGIDISNKMIEKAKELSEGMINVHFYNASSEDLPLENICIDNIISTFSFHHYLNPRKALSEAARVLKPKGRIFILDITPDDFITKLFDKLLKKNQKEHVKQHNTAEFKQMFHDMNLTYIRSKAILLYPIKVHVAEK